MVDIAQGGSVTNGASPSLKDITLQNLTSYRGFTNFCRGFPPDNFYPEAFTMGRPARTEGTLCESLLNLGSLYPF